MSAFLLTQRESEDLVTDVYRSEGTDAAFVFTDLTAAEQYVKDAGLDSTHTVAEVEDVPFLTWMIQSYEEGVTHVAVNPRFDEVDLGKAVNALNVQAQLEHAAQHILQLARPDF